MEETICESDEF